METWIIIAVVLAIKLIFLLMYLCYRARNNQLSRQVFHNQESQLYRSTNAAVSRIHDQEFDHVQEFQPEPNHPRFEPPPSYWSVVHEQEHASTGPSAPSYSPETSRNSRSNFDKY